MAMSARLARTRLTKLTPLLRSGALPELQQAHRQLGQLMESARRERPMLRDHAFSQFSALWALPRQERRQGAILYLHGGGLLCGEREYTAGAGGFLADLTGMRALCPSYRLELAGALEDALESYRYLLRKGYGPGSIALCGDGIGAGLCYRLCLQLKALSLPLPGGILAICPWTGALPEPGVADELLLNRRLLALCAGQLSGPLLAEQDLTGLPPSLIFCAEGSMLEAAARQLHRQLQAAGCAATMRCARDRWQSYLLLGLREDRKDLAAVDRFLSSHICRPGRVRWLRLDNAAKLYPANRRNNWSNIYRLSATLTEPIDAGVMQSALDITARRFPSICARLRKGVFWYYLQALDRAPRLHPEHSYPMTRMSRREMRKCAFRVIVYENRVALELFHSLTDGTGALIFLKSLIAEYLLQKHGIHVEAREGVVGRLEEPSPGELEDSFQKYGGTLRADRRANNAWHLNGTPEKDAFLNITCFRMPVAAVVEKAKAHKVSVTTFLCASLMMALQQLQAQKIPHPQLRKSIKVLMPVNLRNLFPSATLRNFAMYTTPEIQPRLGWYDFEEICQIVRHRMGLDITAKHMSTMIAANLKSEKLLAVRMVPLFIKNLVMKTVFNTVGERKSSMSLSNLGQVRVPEAMAPFVERFDFILGIQATVHNNCAVISYGDSLYMNFIRNICEPELEHQFYLVLRDMGIPVEVQSNAAERS